VRCSLGFGRGGGLAAAKVRGPIMVLNTFAGGFADRFYDEVVEIHIGSTDSRIPVQLLLNLIWT